MAAEGNLQGDAPVLKKKIDFDFDDPSIQHDRVLIIQGKKLYVNSMHLSMFSEYFYGLFNSNFQEKEQKEIELKEVELADFVIFLRMLYPFDVLVTSENLSMLVDLSNRFLTPFIYQKCLEFVENPIYISKMQLEELFDLIGIIDSEVLKNRCIELFNIDQLPRFIEVAKKCNFLALRKPIIEIICAPQQPEMIPYRSIVESLLDNDFATFEEISKKYWLSTDDLANIMPMYTMITLLEYNIPTFEDWLFAKFGYFLAHPSNPLSFKNSKRLMGSLPNMSAAHKRKIEKLLSLTGENWNKEQNHLQRGVKFILQQLAFMLYKEYPEYVVAKTLLLLKDYPFVLGISAIEREYDSYLMRSFNRTHSYDTIEFILRKNFVQTKKTIMKYLQKGSIESLTNSEQLRVLFQSSYEVNHFVFDCLRQNPDRIELLTYFNS